MKSIFSLFNTITLPALLLVEMMGRWQQQLSFIRPCYAWTSSRRFARTDYLASRYTEPVRPLSASFSRGHVTSARTLLLEPSSSRTASSSSLCMSTKKVSLDDSMTTMTTAPTKMINLHTVPVEELEVILKSWGHPKYRAQQIWNWVRVQGVTNVDEMKNIPKDLKAQLKEHATMGSLQLDTELVSKDGTIKRAYRLSDGQLIESVLMPYQDGRYTACISSQAGCAQGCVFCATGQMGFSRQLTPDEILEQVSRFASELAAQDKRERKEQEEESKGKKKKNGGSSAPTRNHGRSTRLSNIVFMGMGEPLANYRNVKTAIERIHDELGIGHRKITVSTVGIVNNISKLAIDLPQVRLAVSLHCATDDERTALLPANKRNGGLKELMQTLQSYIQTTGRRITLEWALIEGENDTPETAHELGKLIHQWLRKDMIHVNVIPLNPTGGYGGSPSGRNRVNVFCQILEQQYKVACTPRVRRGIDINAGCGQLTSEIEKRQRQEEEAAAVVAAIEVTSRLVPGTTSETADNVVVIPVDHVVNDDDDPTSTNLPDDQILEHHDFEEIIYMEDDFNWQDYEYQTSEELSEVDRLLFLVKGTVITAENAVVGQKPHPDDHSPS